MLQTQNSPEGDSETYLRFELGVLPQPLLGLVLPLCVYLGRFGDVTDVEVLVVLQPAHILKLLGFLVERYNFIFMHWCWGEDVKYKGACRVKVSLLRAYNSGGSRAGLV